ncbi:hypothetical protein ANME2D_02971 [Candidatus Methanoperedens nitroreducens]|uniref:Geranylgeranyl transferase type II subunit beta n=1 Tax=Candidatus Methanoperedens nitratireducens TaxID=1392998 RepID=A0A062V0S3_9EURY|nr:prenyltransferase/squalene oxidase repeat-containing protein [Candidatus Methanoperedens nitroreducens]KCZ70942.1 hypothetical protein ANME2D_02971 [Candidatus Methanoperedens nitroreducens]MDJ1421691.1 prenyltransferase/squalene oxidase repeat-containing protein [Candidatus Methanoperedens sp.]
MDGCKERAVNYVMERKCKKGGFCFYRLEEPNASDTYYALSILYLLSTNFKDENTLAYLRSLQNNHGSYQSVYSAFYSIKSLLLLNEELKCDPTPYITRNLRIYSVDNLPEENTSIFEPMYYLIDLCFALKIGQYDNFKNDITDFVLNFQKDDRGFGYTRSTLIETSQALVILNLLNYPINILKTEHFIKKCENPIYGFVNVPDTSPSFIEHIYAGAIASNIISYKPCYINQCIEIIRKCQNNNGGFSRAADGGISTLENTYYAIRSLKLLSALKI